MTGPGPEHDVPARIRDGFASIERLKDKSPALPWLVLGAVECGEAGSEAGDG